MEDAASRKLRLADIARTYLIDVVALRQPVGAMDALELVKQRMRCWPLSEIQTNLLELIAEGRLKVTRHLQLMLPD